MSAIKNKLDDILERMPFQERVCFLMKVCGYSSEDAKDYAETFDD